MTIIDLVIRDKRTNKTKGYGFVSFKDPADFTKAIKVSLLVSRTRLSLLVSVDFTEAIKVSFKDPADFNKAIKVSLHTSFKDPADFTKAIKVSLLTSFKDPADFTKAIKVSLLVLRTLKN